MTPIQIQDGFRSIDDNELSLFESLHNFKLPCSYRSFLLEQNGGSFSTTARINFKSKSGQDCYSFVNVIFGVNTTYDYSDLGSYLRMRDWISAGWLPVADDPGSGLYLLRIDPSNSAVVMLDADHSKIVAEVAPHFHAFIGKLFVAPEREAYFRSLGAVVAAACLGETDMLRRRLDAAGKHKLQSSDNLTLLMHAANARCATSLRYLLALEANINCSTADGWTALHYAARGGSHECCRLLLDAGADVNARNGDGQTPIMLAIGGMRVTAVEELLKHGADLSIKDGGGLDCHDLIAESCDPEEIRKVVLRCTQSGAIKAPDR